MKDTQNTFNLLCQGNQANERFLLDELGKLKDLQELLDVGKAGRKRMNAERSRIRKRLKRFQADYPSASNELEALKEKLWREAGFYPSGGWSGELGLRSKRGALKFGILTIYSHFQKDLNHWPLCKALAAVLNEFNIPNSVDRSWGPDSIHKIIKRHLPKA